MCWIARPDPNDPKGLTAYSGAVCFGSGISFHRSQNWQITPRTLCAKHSRLQLGLGRTYFTSLDFSIPVAYSLEFRSSYGLHQKALISAFHSRQDFYHRLERDIGLCLLVCCTCDVHTLLRHIKSHGTGGTSMADHLRDRLKW